MGKNKTSFFYNKFSKEIINAPCNGFEFAEWGINNSEVFKHDLNNKIAKFNSKTDSKIFKRAIYDEGWSYVNICDNYCFIEALNFEISKEILNIVAQKNNIKDVCMYIEDLNSVFLNTDDIEFFLNTGKFGNHVFNSHLENNIELNELIKELQLLDCSRQIFVFGSINKDKIVPPDLDILIDATEIPIKIEDQNKILALVEKYSLRLDPYIKTENSILAVDSNVFTYEFNWIDLCTTEKKHIFQDFKKLEEDVKGGKPLNELNFLPTTIEELFKNNPVRKKIKYN